ncbi:MAG TPA: urea carboxylase-associated family protein [Lacisediminihabitans sp.]|uniref:urea carboxylase-associated family protein n=1 Tax=Lacisediminihabitans sp. TaxID=2787631 RepID=UPI002ED9094A
MTSTATTTEWATAGTILVPARGRLALKLHKGQRLTITDVKGQQVMDMIAALVDDPDERLSCMFSRVSSGMWDLKEGYSVFSTRCTPLLRVVHDDNGTHNMTGGYCSQWSNAIRYGTEKTFTCYDNLVEDWEELGLDVTKISPDMCISLFMNIAHHPDGHMEIQEPTTKPGDSIVFEALEDVYIGLSNCPEEHNPCNAYHVTEIEVTVE